MKFGPNIHTFRDIKKNCIAAIQDEADLYRKQWEIYNKLRLKIKQLKKTESVMDLLNYYRQVEKNTAGDFLRWLRTRDVVEVTTPNATAELTRLDPQQKEEWFTMFAQYLDSQLVNNKFGLDNDLSDILKI